ncbi:TRM11 family SAM-dependent methyltransferase [Cellulomonas xiejunii]|uniref:TRM11 family SAM-dependent methyltransferase n=1 Tax=Cellulomonas xiejunii TaxID=2968083 RepID=UPI001D0EAEB9|nr:SAM-dependent methyltransferase [Cellulomonas xiejunii]MCC2316225.1 SAM-dependent methyltransferase [Cellulomonas xiejunii]
MPQYAILVQPSANRVYTQNAARLLSNELLALDDLLLGGRVAAAGGPVERRLGGVPYLVLDAPDLTADDLRVLANLSSLFALFELRDDGSLLPLDAPRLDRYDDDLLTILKYIGKTNEQLTRLLLNLTAAAALPVEGFLGSRVRVLDPMCGRGTTLNQALMYGWDAYGVDVDRRDVEAYTAFAARWLQDKRLKHRSSSSRVRVAGRNLGRRTTFELAATKDEYRAGDVQTLEITQGDTLDTDRMYRAGFFDVVVADAPYGIQHGSVTGPRTPSRSPRDLLADAIPVWTTVLRRGGAMGLSWNTKVLPREDLVAMLRDAGLEPLDGPAFLGLAHRVDQAIERDVVVARKPR